MWVLKGFVQFNNMRSNIKGVRTFILVQESLIGSEERDLGTLIVIEVTAPNRKHDQG